MKEYKPKILIKHITKATRESPTCREAEGIALKIINEFVYGICFAYSLINCNFKNYDLNMRFFNTLNHNEFDEYTKNYIRSLV